MKAILLKAALIRDIVIVQDIAAAAAIILFVSSTALWGPVAAALVIARRMGE